MSFPFICFDTEDNSGELSKFIRATRNGVKSMEQIWRVARKVSKEKWLTEAEAKRILARGKASLMEDKRVTQIAAITAEGKRFYCAGDVKEFLKWLLAEAKAIMRATKSGTCFVYALNVQYDLGNMFADVLDELDCTLVGGRMIKAVWGPITFVDVWNLYQCSVKKLGETFGLQKLETGSMATDKAYVFRDTEIIHAAITFVWNFAEEMGLDHVPPTMGSLGVNLWRSWGGETIHHSNEMTRDAIFGGRVELFKTRNFTPNVFYCDINSLYPFCMLKEFPGELEDTGTELKRFGIAQVKIQVPYREISVLPYRNDEGKILYPYGTLIGVWTIAEINAAVERGAKILEVYDCLSTDETITPYRSYMEKVYSIRKASTSKTTKNLFKLLMNTLYGRTGTTGVIGRTVTRNENNEDKGTVFGSRVLVNYAMPLGQEVNWSHAAYITAYGRLELLKYLEIIGAQNLIYCDTDSVIFDAPGGKIPFTTGGELGEMKIETKCSVCNEAWHPDAPCEKSKQVENWGDCETYAPKMYRVAGQYKAKGVPRKLQRQFIETGNASFDLPFKFREAVAFFDRGNVKKLSVWRQVDKENRANYDKKELAGDRYYPCEIQDNDD